MKKIRPFISSDMGLIQARDTSNARQPRLLVTLRPRWQAKPVSHLRTRSQAWLHDKFLPPKKRALPKALVRGPRPRPGSSVANLVPTLGLLPKTKKHCGSRC